MKKVLNTIVLLLLCCLFLNSCSNKTENKELKQMAEDITKNYMLPYMTGGGVSLGLHNMDGTIVDTRSFKLNSNETFKKMISLGNMIDNDRKYKIMLFVDYEQSEFIVDDKIVLEHEFKAKNNENVLTPFEIKDLKEGFHDVFFVIAKYSDIHSLDEEFRKHTDMNNLLFIRFNILVDNSKVPNIEYAQFDNIKKSVFDGVLVSKEEHRLQRWLVENTNNDELNFFIHVGNNSYNDNQKYAIITLLDWKQVDFKENKDVLFFSLQKGKQTVIPSNILLSKDVGVQELVTILIYNPYIPLDISNKNIVTGIRVGINNT